MDPTRGAPLLIKRILNGGNIDPVYDHPLIVLLITTLACQCALTVLLFIIGLVNQISFSNSVLFQNVPPRLSHLDPLSMSFGLVETPNYMNRRIGTGPRPWKQIRIESPAIITTLLKIRDSVRLSKRMENLMTFEEGSISTGTKAGPSSSESGTQEQVKEDASVVTTIDTRGLESNWVTSIKERLRIWRGRPKASSDSISCSIYRVTHCLRQSNEKVYDPQLISIGPLHYEKRKSQLQAMEEYKWRCLDDILSRSREGSLERYLAAVKELEERARKCYSQVIPLDSNSFAEMMVLDACFMIEFFRRDNNEDPIFQLKWLTLALKADIMMMLENQIPFFILHRLFDLIDDSRPHSIQEMATILFPDILDSTVLEKIRESNIQIQHLLHLMHASFILKVEEKCPGTSVFQRIPCASKLKDAGIKFKERTEKKDVLDIFAIKFEKGSIEIPSIQFWDRANLIFLNLIAFEQCYCPCKKYVTAYAAFMNCLISNSKDVEILCREGIIDNWVGSDGDMAALFNNMARELTVYEDDFYFSGICKEINQYCESTWPKLRGTLVHDYFKNPWAIVSFLAALLLLLLTITQTFFSSFPKFAYG